MIARGENDTGRIVEAHHSLWPVLCGDGTPKGRDAHIEQGVALYDRERHGKLAFLYAGHDPGACCLFHRGMVHWSLGYPERALQDVQASCRLAEELRHPQTQVIALWLAAWIHCNRGERELGVATFDQVTTIAQQYAISLWGDISAVFAAVIRREPTSAAAVTEIFERVHSMHFVTSWRRHACLCALAELCLDAEYADLGLRILRSIAASERGAAMGTEIVRIEGELILKRERHAFDAAKRCFDEAIQLARSREQKSNELRAVTGLARLLGEEGRREEAHDILAGVYNWFTEGFDTGDLKSAKALLDALA